MSRRLGNSQITIFFPDADSVRTRSWLIRTNPIVGAKHRAFVLFWAEFATNPKAFQALKPQGDCAKLGNLG